MFKGYGDFSPARRISRFFKSGVIWIGVEHFLAMFPATILVPMLVNNHFDKKIIDVALVLFTSGIGTTLFIIISRGKIPAYVGSSFAYIGLTIYLISSISSEPNSVSPEMAYSYVGWAYIFGGVLLLALSFIYRFKGISKFLAFLLPAPIIGPAISLIGLELADNAAADSGFSITNGTIDKNSALIAISTLIVIILMSVTRRKFLKNVAIIIGMGAGYLISIMLNGLPNFSSEELQLVRMPSFSLPFLNFPPNLLGLFIAVIPATLIVFTENIGRITIITRMTGKTQDNQPIFNQSNVSAFKSSVFCHGIATTVATIMGSVPNTIYAENIAVMGIHSSDLDEQRKRFKEKDPFIRLLSSPYSYVPLLIAAFIAILVSMVGVLQTFLLSVPKPVIGGIELFLFGIISAPGIQLLVEQRVNYKKISNQILTASVLISGISGLTVNLGIVELKGMGLGFIVGVVLNLLISFLKWAGNLNDYISFEEILGFCLKNMGKDKTIIQLGTRNTINSENIGVIKKQDFEIADISENLSFDGVYAFELEAILSGASDHLKLENKMAPSEFVKDVVRNSTYASIGKDGTAMIVIEQTANNIYVFIQKQFVPEDSYQYLNDYQGQVDEDADGNLQVQINGEFPLRKLKKLLLQFS